MLEIYVVLCDLLNYLYPGIKLLLFLVDAENFLIKADTNFVVFFQNILCKPMKEVRACFVFRLLLRSL